ncbi:MAG: DUF4105 domain-containing protein [Paraglaciecola sp.]|uniref:Lnb N-terminal periplasmic domain-containing protein n=1 Tax=Alteromonadaceae TaxID=72275 RepID=UPI00273DD921|nr:MULTISPECIES: DUF4105 domain-containing protein [Alteromonadaceae]MDP5030695.1 DUF4105 domain-containing protein [Paraglaciecola sp.]MDP5132295.1 DUF4105 domain-containing protein [Paraglaciecola sp.]MDP5459109.1 DUF4105 domain-containing protein [Alishewanella sp. SMS8]
MTRFFLAICLCLFGKLASAYSFENQESISRLANSPTWLKLLVYDNGRSFVTSSRFFLDGQGQINPKAELISTLKAFAEPQQEMNPDNHPQCRFAGRYAWLKTQLDFTTLGITEMSCPAFQAFSQEQEIESVSIVFATGFLGNPASYYGHLLIKLNSANSELSDLQNTAINFGADVPVNENMAAYIIKGIIGGYDSAFTQQQYFLHAGNYGESELRDLWEYELDLDKTALRLLLGHIWELLEIDYQYFFFNRNCAFHMGQLLELVLQNNITDASRLWATPQAIMQNLAKDNTNQKPIIKHIKYHPSRQSRLYQRFAMLSNEQKLQLSNMVHTPEKISIAQLADFNIEQQQQIVDTLIDYFQFMLKADKGDADLNKIYYKNSLLLRYQLPPGRLKTAFISNRRPHLGRKPSLAAIQLVHASNAENFAKLQIRPAYYDALDAQEGHVKYSALSMGEFSLGFTSQRVFIKDLSLLKIESVRANLTGLPGDQNHSWYIDIGSTQTQLGCTTCNAVKVSSGIGYAFQSSPHFNISGFIGAGYSGRDANVDNSFIATRLLTTWYISDSLATNLDAEVRHFKSGADTHHIKFATRYALSTNTEVRLNLSQDSESTEIGFSLGLYW